MDELERVRNAVRAHRDAQDHGRLNDCELYRAVLPDEPVPHSKDEPDTAPYWLQKCREYWSNKPPL